MVCNSCGGILSPIRVETYPGDLPTHKRAQYNRVCDVECLECGEVYYSQGYDEGNKLNLVKDIKGS